MFPSLMQEMHGAPATHEQRISSSNAPAVLQCPSSWELISSHMHISMCAPARLTVTTCRLAQLPLLKDSAGTDSATAAPAVAAAAALLPGSGTSDSLIVMVSPASGGSSSLHGTPAFSASQLPREQALPHLKEQTRSSHIAGQ